MNFRLERRITAQSLRFVDYTMISALLQNISDGDDFFRFLVNVGHRGEAYFLGQGHVRPDAVPRILGQSERRGWRVASDRRGFSRPTEAILDAVDRRSAFRDQSTPTSRAVKGALKTSIGLVTAFRGRFVVTDFAIIVEIEVFFYVPQWGAGSRSSSSRRAARTARVCRN